MPSMRTRQRMYAPPRYVDAFDALSGVWQPVAGTLAVSGGGLQGATMADWLGNLVTNGESWTGGSPPTGWQNREITSAAVDSAVDPGVSSVTAGALNSTVIKLTRTGVELAYLWANPTLVTSAVGGTYAIRTLAYAPSANTVVTGAQVRSINPSSSSRITVEDAWSALAFTVVATGSSIAGFYLDVLGNTVGDVAYYDQTTVYRQATAAILAPWRSPNFVATLHHRSPAVVFGDERDRVPFGWMFRRTDDLSYWELRVLPNTAGNDLQIVQVTAGVETVRAEADIDWTSDDVDEIELSVLGTDISTRHKKSGEASWTAGPSYASATQGQTERGMGPLFYGTGQNRLDAMEVVGR